MERKMKHTPETLMVQPINKALILEILNGLATDKKDNEEFVIHVGAFYKGIEVNNECIYSFLNTKFVNGQKQMMLEVPVKIKTKTERGFSTPLFTEFYFDIAIDTENLLLPPVTLKEFMGGRYNYNPRIATNTREFIKEVNQ